MACSYTRGPRFSQRKITHKIILQVVDYSKRETTYYKVNSYKLFESLLRLGTGSMTINKLDPALTLKIKEELKVWWEHDLQRTEDFLRPDLMYILEL